MTAEEVRLAELGRLVTCALEDLRTLGRPGEGPEAATRATVRLVVAEAEILWLRRGIEHEKLVWSLRAAPALEVNEQGGPGGN